MKLVRYGEPGAERPGILDGEGRIRDVSSLVADFAGEALSPASLGRIRNADLAALPLAETGVRLGPCVSKPGHFIAIGLNYVDHAHESNMPIPTEPVVFSKAPSSISGPTDDVVMPEGSEKSDWEVEIAMVIGTAAFNVSEADALDHVAGFCICNDVSERSYQIERGGQWIKGKSLPTYGPIGPWLVTRDEIADVQNLGLWLDVNGERRQTGSTSSMIFSLAHIISYLSRFMRLEPGDIITTGTPPGVGMGMKPPTYLKRGDVMTLGIDGLGDQRQTVR
ncbi:fumarylacetoacetate hydrolase family protein [Aliirhizobium cellulosilyticum]|uniref:2-keto-4-pentenoate hydratase/2-oxohepta-3-ene-1,7-dioic acid hydratase in catechol pathway n=1 Tax=Aliirhizobium cellulosilyticum TaxID=393664 RepID=A0A7W6TEV9_9HYPH|nr:fumarylacetoacetate hydrolase family protein [Rhizobium cellulosilyticum]MBB4349560.1 2-keto-4-pentenoate hydratase/2-oxohepta-3-ene-1,7-dioic acid hydratase in catechol pathway [Rhizobium cellulosilyticum]MBB4412218.1 2-keto-4-pentenoate hydratase/2-oxohepta-3-ene-1,7-dioic acid hydratase in catechol pathway [Rhizobium cellulosilyticum]MBB4446849.1 2-keto-4-pentenoate hydratase/2-oxohepta-3-ene-1,7-dioic acid hydratase in catechol pathway [Rhizobium cellulosilyticum]